jgi:hypothetical protein
MPVLQSASHHAFRKVPSRRSCSSGPSMASSSSNTLPTQEELFQSATGLLSQRRASVQQRQQPQRQPRRSRSRTRRGRRRRSRSERGRERRRNSPARASWSPLRDAYLNRTAPRGSLVRQEATSPSTQAELKEEAKAAAPAEKAQAREAPAPDTPGAPGGAAGLQEPTKPLEERLKL